ncbi:MAG: Spy/CpxP family protein refolding chaperone [Mariprofundaceae bacterium]|nr:Spy/CpxP family protein refolding chaperone [Mariprofundaceae bacterium]
MMKTKKIFWIPLLAMMAVAWSAQANGYEQQNQQGICGEQQGAGPMNPRGSHKDHMQGMIKSLGLSEAQQKKMKAIHKGSRDEMKALHHALRANHKAMQALDTSDKDYQKNANILADKQGILIAKKIKMHSANRAKFDQILTPEQRKKATIMHEKHFQQMQGHGHRPMGE